MLQIVLLIFLMLTNTITSRKLLDDDSEQSGDFDSGINLFGSTQQRPIDSNAMPNATFVAKAFSNQQQRQQKQEKLHTPITPSSSSQSTGPAVTQRSTAKSKQTNRKADLSDDISDFIDLMPIDKIKAKIEEYYRNDMDVQHIFEYMHSKEFFELRKSVVELAIVRESLQYLSKNGLKVKSVVRELDNRVGVSKIRQAHINNNSQQSFGTNVTIGGINALVEDVLGLLPQGDIFILFFDKLDSSPKFAAFVKSISDPNFHSKYALLWKSKELHSAFIQLKKHRIDIVKIIQIIQGYFILGTF